MPIISPRHNEATVQDFYLNVKVRNQHALCLKKLIDTGVQICIKIIILDTHRVPYEQPVRVKQKLLEQPST